MEIETCRKGLGIGCIMVLESQIQPQDMFYLTDTPLYEFNLKFKS